MKKTILKWIISSICISMLLVVIGGIKIYNDFFPMAEPVNFPSNDEIIAIDIKKDTINLKYTDPEILKMIIEQLSKAKETRLLTVHDRPTVRDYYTVDIITKDNDMTYTSFIYQENSKWYLEQPYTGIYEISGDVSYLFKKDT
ncbi:MAG: DUF5301 domain-containing protein [Zhenhengia sp.]|jgi:hypothetical protein|uniref:DUF5301 domain-containing protein n=1 Tax=Zhenhengia sp. TaxID=2944208 RepID=UPI00290E012E|nr:DUF5301 domain-containing protein [Clostridiales bacterium]MDU6855835.1 DUF5301 domain-containing protein [Clostridiales bacterium]MDU6975781.1 DUF5301 domain-containing protein [Clostridiales bacterium]